MFNHLFTLLTQAGFASALSQQRNGISGWWWVFIFLLVVLVVWWLLTRATNEEPDLHVHHEGEHGEDADHHAAQPEVRSSHVVSPVQTEPDVVVPAPTHPDDLTIVEGVGPKVNGVLQAAGITTFAQLAAAEISKLQEILDAASYNYMDPASWPEQAKLAAEGNWEAFKALTDNLKGGRKAE